MLQLRGPWAHQHSAGRCSSSDVGRAAFAKGRNRQQLRETRCGDFTWCPLRRRLRWNRRGGGGCCCSEAAVSLQQLENGVTTTTSSSSTSRASGQNRSVVVGSSWQRGCCTSWQRGKQGREGEAVFEVDAAMHDMRPRGGILICCRRA